MTVRIGPIGVAQPETILEQGDIVDLSVRSGGTKDVDRTSVIFRRCGVRQRGIAAEEGSPRLYQPGTVPGTAARMALYEHAAADMAVQAGAHALRDAEVQASEITHTVTASCTGFSAPGVDLSMIHRLGLPADVQRTHIGFMGCHAAVNALRVAGAIAATEPNARVLLCCVEVCSVHLQHEDVPERDIINALFADGAGACVVSQARLVRPLGELCGTASMVWPGAASQMRWSIGDTGFPMRLAKEVPDSIRSVVGPWIRGWLDTQGFGIGSVGSWAIHPGGPSVIDAVRDGLGLPESACETSRGVLAACGNMSSATLLWVLRALAESPRPTVGVAFGPGLAGEAVLIGPA